MSYITDSVYCNYYITGVLITILYCDGITTVMFTDDTVVIAVAKKRDALFYKLIRALIEIESWLRRL